MEFPSIRTLSSQSLKVNYTVGEAREYLTTNGYGQRYIKDVRVTLDADTAFVIGHFDVFNQTNPGQREETALMATENYGGKMKNGTTASSLLLKMFQDFSMLVIAMMRFFGERKTSCKYLQFVINNCMEPLGRTISTSDIIVVIINVERHLNGLHLMETILHETVHALLAPYNGDHGFEFLKTGSAVMTLAKAMFGASFKDMCLYASFDEEL